MFLNKLLLTSTIKKRINHSIVRNNSFKSYGKHQFIGDIARPYLNAVGLPCNTMESLEWIKNFNEDKVAEAILLWAKDNGASVYCHWFQPLAASGVRHGGSGQVHNSMIKFINGKPTYEFKGENLLKGETDGSSFPHGGLRSTNKAGGYLSFDPTSPIFLRGDTIFIPSCFFTYNGDSIDEKIPLHRSSEQLCKEGTRLLNLLGMKNVNKVDAKIGLEQEFFLVPRNAFMKRPDLQMTGRTVLGRLGPRGQDMCDHYMSPPSTSSSALACMQEIQNQCFIMGIPLRTRHREVAPNQYEFAPGI
jgi:glutamine synthetase